MKHHGKNGRCPCGSGKKYKRCCLREGRRWYQDRKGRAIPEKLALSHAGTPIARQAIIEHLAEEGKLDELRARPWDETGPGSALGLLSLRGRLSCLHGMGLPPELMLFVERTGHLPDRPAWEHWTHTGKWPIHPDSNDSYCNLVASGLASVVEAYPYVPAERGETFPVEFIDAFFVGRENDIYPLLPYNDEYPITSILHD
jgi:hypothetical protein